MTGLVAPVGAFVAALAVSAGLTPIVRRAALSRGHVVGERADRWHRSPTPVLGGIGIFIAFLLAAGLGFAVDPGALSELGGAPGPLWSPLTGLVGAGLLMFGVGLVDDLRPLHPATKLLAQVCAGALLLSGGVMLRLLQFPAADMLLSLLWFVGLTNALNLLDNMDGLAAGTAAIAAFWLGTIFLLDGFGGFALIAFALMGSLIGFLVHNWAPARIFMGDSGSLFLGVSLAGLALAPAPGLSRGLFGVIALPVLILAIPILDTALVTASRISEGRPIAMGGRDHTSHRLVALGLPEPKAVRLLWFLAALGGGIGVLFRTSGRAYAYLVGGILLVGLALLGAYLIGVTGPRSEAAGSAKGRLTRWFAWQRERPLLAIAIDLALFVTAYYGAYVVRWDPPALAVELEYLRRSLPLFLAAKVAAFVVVGVYRIDWRYFDLPAGGILARGVLLASMLSVVGAVFLVGPGLSRGVVVIDLVLTGLLTAAARLSFRLFEAAGRTLHADRVPTLVVGRSRDLPVLMAHFRTSTEPIRPVGFVDIDAGARSGFVMGVPRYAGLDQLPRALHTLDPGAVLLIERGDGPEPNRESLQGMEFVGLPVYRLSVGLTRSGPSLTDLGGPPH